MSSDTDRPHKGEGHRKRLRERFITSGLDGFQDYEVLELLLTLSTPRKDCKEPAKEALKRFKNLQGVFEALPSELSEIKGLGPSNQFIFRLIKEAAERYLAIRMKESEIITNKDRLLDYLNMAIRYRRQECFLVVYLNAKNMVLGEEILFSGSITSSSVYPREVVQSALNNKAAALIFAHNHPSGNPGPSPEDIAITRQLVLSCHLMGITVHEHIIVGADKHYSFAEEGHIARFRLEAESGKTL